MKKSFFKIFAIFLIAFTFGVLPHRAPAQCPMCKMSAEQNLKDGGTAGKGLNKGILYMFSAPYLIVGTIALLWWRNRKEEDEITE